MGSFGEMWALVLIGIAVLGGAIAYGMSRNARRDRGKDAVTETATRELYNSIDRGGGDVEVTRGPEERPRAVREGEAMPDYVTGRGAGGDSRPPLH